MSTLVTAAALIANPIVLGAMVGMALRRIRGRRLRGFVAVLACLALPTVAAVGLLARFPIVGLWDAAIEGFLFGAGVLWTSHRALARGANVALLVSSLVVSLLLVELLCRMLLPPPPGYSSAGGPHLLLNDPLDLTHQPWSVLGMDLVCSVVYGDRYAPILDLSSALRDIVTPQTFSPRPDATRHVLHLGDSMAFGFGLPREETVTAGLERLEPGVEHINAAVPNSAPDAYLAELNSWVETHGIDLVVMHVYEGNDLDGLDSPFPCCDWQSLLVYGSAGATLRCAQATESALSRAGMWLRYHNPPPYLLRALVGTSTAAAHLAARTVLEPYFLADQPVGTQLDHLETILRSARDLLAAHHISFVVDVVPTRAWLETLETRQHYAPRIVERAERAGVPVLDGSDVFRNAVVGGQQLFGENHPYDIHFSAAGHALWASWLHEQLAAVALRYEGMGGARDGARAPDVEGQN